MVPVQDTSRNSRRAIAFIVVLAVHAVLIWGLNAGLTDIIREKVLGDIKTVEIAPPKEEDLKPPPPPPRVDIIPPPFVPPPEIDIETPVEETRALQVTTNVRPTELPPPPPPPKVADVSPKMDMRRMTVSPDDFYPNRSRSDGEEGNVTIEMHVLETGKVDSIVVKQSSGFPRLDEAAVAYAKNVKVIPGTHEGKPAAMLFAFRVVFKLKK